MGLAWDRFLIVDQLGTVVPLGLGSCRASSCASVAATDSGIAATDSGDGATESGLRSPDPMPAAVSSIASAGRISKPEM
jgi:hypothetical protein